RGLGTEEKPVWRFTLHAPSFVPFLRYGERAELRQRLWTAYSELATAEPHANEPLIRKILSLRHRRAEILGHRRFADLVLARRMAKDGDSALRFVEDLHTRIVARFREECAELEAFRD